MLCYKPTTPEIAFPIQLARQGMFPQGQDGSCHSGIASYIIGEGGFSTVFLETLCRSSGKQVLCAVKRLNTVLHSKGHPTESKEWREVKILKALQESDVSLAYNKPFSVWCLIYGLTELETSESGL